MMTWDEIRSSVVVLPGEDQGRLIAFLVRSRQKRKPAEFDETESQLADRERSHWLSLEELKQHWGDQ
jgi:hypothetical protein